MASADPQFSSPLPAGLAGSHSGGLALEDRSACRKWRFVGEPQAVALGRADAEGERIAFSVSPGEWIVIDAPDTPSVAVPPPATPIGIRVVDITHLRATLRITGNRTRNTLARLCSLDFTEQMFPSGAAARTLVAKVATEVVRLDQHGQRSYLLLTSRSFGRYLYDAVVDSMATAVLGADGLADSGAEPPSSA